MIILLRSMLIVTLFAVASGCAVQNSKPPSLNGPLPTSVLVLPPLNNSVEVNAPYTFISTISRPLAEQGYYVFPVSVIDAFLKNNGLPTPAEMNAVPIDKFNEHIAPDAILYTTITEWGQKYQIVSSNTVVKADLKLVDAKTGQLLWKGRISEKRSSSDNNQNGLMGALVSAVVDQVAGSVKDYTPELSRTGAYNTLSRYSSRLPAGPYRLKYLKAAREEKKQNKEREVSKDKSASTN